MTKSSNWRWPSTQFLVWLKLQRATPSYFKPIRANRERVKWVDHINDKFSIP